MTRYAFVPIAATAALLAGCSPTTAIVGFGSHGAVAPAATASASTADIASRPIGSQLLPDVLQQKLLEQVNDYRSRHDLPPLAADRSAAAAADWMARYQASIRTMTHTSTVAGMEDFGNRYGRMGGARLVSGAENIAWHQLGMKKGAVSESYEELAARIVGGWIDSPPHRKNLLLSAARGRAIAGLGVARGVNGGTDGVYSTIDLFYVEQGRDATGG